MHLEDYFDFLAPDDIRISSTLALRDYYARMHLPAVAPRAACHGERHGTVPMSGVQSDMQKRPWTVARQSARGATTGKVPPTRRVPTAKVELRAYPESR